MSATPAQRRQPALAAMIASRHAAVDLLVPAVEDDAEEHEHDRSSRRRRSGPAPALHRDTTREGRDAERQELVPEPTAPRPDAGAGTPGGFDHREDDRVQRDDADQDREDPEAREDRDLLDERDRRDRRPGGCRRASVRMDAIAGGKRCEYETTIAVSRSLRAVVLLVVAVHRLHGVGEGACREEDRHDQDQRIEVQAEQRHEAERPDARQEAGEDRHPDARPGAEVVPEEERRGPRW